MRKFWTEDHQSKETICPRLLPSGELFKFSSFVLTNVYDFIPKRVELKHILYRIRGKRKIKRAGRKPKDNRDGNNERDKKTEKQRETG